MSPENTPKTAAEIQAAVIATAAANFRRVRAYLEKSGTAAPNQQNSTKNGRLRRTNTADSRDPKPLSDLIDHLTEQTDLAAPLAVSGLTFGWAEIVGDEVAEHVAIEHFNQNTGELILKADSTAWATQIRMLVVAINTKIDEEIGAGIVTSITVLGPKAPSWKYGQRSVPGRGPRDTYG
jgi:predicted nucleic acid-binding Zn ribbon protein